MTRGRTCFWMMLTMVCLGSAADAQSLSRESVSKALRKAEQRRMSYRVEYEMKFPAGQRPAESARTRVMRLTDQQGRYRQETRRPPQKEGADRVVQIDLWDGTYAIQEFYYADKQYSARHNVLISPVKPWPEDIDQLGPLFGLRCPMAEESVSQLLVDPDTETHVREAMVGDTPVVEVEILGLPLARSVAYVMRYDPQRDWLLLEMELFAHSQEEGKPLREGTLHVHKKQVLSQFILVDGVWMPGRVDEYFELAPNTESTITGHYTTLLHSVQMNPETDRSAFTVNLAALPRHSQIADARWGGTYRLGEDVVLMDGRLHQLVKPVEEPVDPMRFGEVMAGSTPIVDTELAQDVDASGNRSLSKLLRLSGYGLLGAGTLGVVLLFFRHRFSGR